MPEIKHKILIINGSLGLGGAEKLVFEIAKFAKKHNIQPDVLILDGYEKEHYDSVFEKLGIKVIRTRLDGIKHFRAPLKMFRSIYWLLKLKYRSQTSYDSIHVIGLYNVYKILGKIEHRHRFFWHVNNNVQYQGGKYNFYGDIFDNEDDTIVCINKYQLDEIYSEYDTSVLKTKITLFKLFLND